MQTLPLPPVQFHSYTLDFFTSLPPGWGFNCILKVIDHLTILACLVPCTMGEKKLSAVQIKKLLFVNIVMFFKMPKRFVHDSDPGFIALLWGELWHMLSTLISAFTAFHPSMIFKVS